MYKVKKYNEYLDFYKKHLNSVILPFWLSKSIDNEYGGYFTCFDNVDGSLVSDEKFTWSQGRMVWVFSKLAGMDFLSDTDKRQYIFLAEQGVKFCMKNCLLNNGNCTFLMDRKGIPKPQFEGHECDTSIYADCFIVIGLSKYASITSDQNTLHFAVQLYKSILTRLKYKNYKSEPYPIPAGYSAHGITMIMLNTSQELAEAMRNLESEEYFEINANSEKYMHEILNNYMQQNGLLHELRNVDNKLSKNTMLEKYVNPGHSVESMWFVIHQALKSKNWEVIQKAVKVINNTIDIGWDKEYGGLFLFVDENGGKPFGSTKGVENEKMVCKINDDWDSKLWWTHSESLYATLLAFCLTGENSLLIHYQKLFEYTFNTFPNPNTEIGEWIQIRDRKGNPVQKVVALPVKDPFHITRSIILIIELLYKFLFDTNQVVYERES